jgi:hypothetical protein
MQITLSKDKVTKNGKARFTGSFSGGNATVYLDTDSRGDTLTLTVEDEQETVQ